MNHRLLLICFLTFGGFLLTGHRSLGQSTQPKKQAEKTWQLLPSGVDASLRGLDVVSDQVIWASGTGGTVLRSTNAGETWDNVSIADARELDFRDIEAFDGTSAVVISAGTPARIYRTTDAGKTWTQVFEHENAKAFFDAISFWDNQHGIVMSDPVDDRVLLLESTNGGAQWKALDSARRPKVIPGEGGFAASGTNMVLLQDGTCLIALGAAREKEKFPTSRILRSSDRGQTWQVVEAPIARSAAGGIFSMSFAGQHGIAVGGNYLEPNNAKSNLAITLDGGASWKNPAGNPPRGYRSGVALRNHKGQLQAVAVGTNGTDVSMDGGISWKAAGTDAFHAVRFAPNGTVYASGAGGRIAKSNSLFR